MTCATWNDTHPRGSFDLGQIDLIARLRINTTAYVDLDTHLLPITVVDLWVFRSVTNRPQNGRLPSVCPPNDKDPETAEFLSKILEITCAFCRHCGEVCIKKSRTESRSGGEGEERGLGAYRSDR